MSEKDDLVSQIINGESEDDKIEEDSDADFMLSVGGGVLAASASLWPWGVPNLLNRLLPNVFGVSLLLFGTSVVSTSHPLCQTLIKEK